VLTTLVINLSLVSATLVIKLLPLSATPVINQTEILPLINVTSGKFIASVIDTGDERVDKKVADFSL